MIRRVILILSLTLVVLGGPVIVVTMPAASGGAAASANSFQFDGANDSFTVDTTPTLNTDDVSISWWFKADGDSNNDYMMTLDEGLNDWISYAKFLSNGAVEIKWSANNINRTIATTTQSLDTDGLWHHIMVTYDADRADEIELWLDGTKENSSSAGSGDLDSLSGSWPLRWGSYNGGSNAFDGLLYDVQLHHSVLVIGDVYDSGSPVAMAGTGLLEFSADNVSGTAITNTGTDSSGATLNSGATTSSTTP